MGTQAYVMGTISWRTIRNPQLFNDYEITKGKMDDVFLAVTGKALAGGAEK